MVFPSLSQAWHNHFNKSASLKAAIPGGIWTGQVPEGTLYPYAWADIAQVNTHYTMLNRMEYARIFTHIYALGAEDVEAVAGKFKDHYDESRLEFAVGSQAYCVAVIPQTYKLLSENLRHKSGALIFRASLLYFVLYQRSR